MIDNGIAFIVKKKTTSPNQEMYLWLIIDCVVFNVPLDFSSFIGSYVKPHYLRLGCLWSWGGGNINRATSAMTRLRNNEAEPISVYLVPQD